MEKLNFFIDKIRKNSLQQSVSSSPFHNRYATSYNENDANRDCDNVSRHFLTNGWATAGPERAGGGGHQQSVNLGTGIYSMMKFLRLSFIKFITLYNRISVHYQRNPRFRTW